MRNAVETTVVLLLLLLITLSGCGKSDVEAYREASNVDTVNAYEDFLRKHGDSEFRAEETIAKVGGEVYIFENGRWPEE